MSTRTFRSNGNSGGGDSVVATSGNTLTGGTLPQPMSFGDGVNYEFFGIFSGLPFTLQNLGNISTNQKYCHSCQVIDGNVVLVKGGSVYIDQVQGSPVDQLRATIQGASGGAPDGVPIATVDFSVVGGTPTRQVFTFPNAVELTAPAGGGNVEYFLVLERTGAISAGNYWVIGLDNIYGVNTAPYRYDGVSWVNSNLVPSWGLTMLYVEDQTYISAQNIAGSPVDSNRRMRTKQISSSSGLPQYDTIPAVLQSSFGFTTMDAAIGDPASVIISGAVAGFGSIPLNPISRYVCNRSDGHIIVGTTGTIVGRALLTDTMLITQS